MKRTWTVGTGAFGEAVDREAVVAKMVDLEALGDAVGGVFMMAPLRAPDPETGEYVTRGWHMEWNSFSPAGRAVTATEDEADPEEPGAAD